jgi:hypothetical protein
MMPAGCTRCGRRLRRSHRRHVFERLLGVIGMLPYRCTVCHRRCWRFQWGAGLLVDTSDAHGTPGLDAAQFPEYRGSEARVPGSIVFVVSREQDDLYQELRLRLRHDPEFEVILDRRGGDRRARAQPIVHERRRHDRRTADLADALSGLGYAVVRRGPEGLVATPR